MVKQYIGARYVPIFDGEYNAEKAYEPLTIVTYLNNSYTSKKTVPAGTLPSNTEFWALTGNYNAQVEQYREEVENYASDVTALDTKFSNFNIVNVKDFGATGDGTTDDTEAFVNALASNTTAVIYVPAGTYKLSSTISIYDRSMRGESCRESILHFTNGNLYFGGFSNSLSDLKIENDTSTFALECYYMSKATNVRNILIKAENCMKITRSWFFTVDNIRCENTSTTGTNMQLDADTHGGVNAGNFNGIFLGGGAHGVVFTGDGIHESNVFKSTTIENTSDTAVIFEATRGTTNKFIGLYCEGCTVPETSHPWVLNSTATNDAVSFEELMLRGNNTASVVTKGGGLFINCISNTVYAKLCTDGLAKCLMMNNFDTSGSIVYSTTHIVTRSITVTVAANGTTTIPSQNGIVLEAYSSSTGIVARDLIRYGSGDTTAFLFRNNTLYTTTGDTTLTVVVATTHV